MKNIVPSLGKLQVALTDRSAPLSAIGKARKELFAAIREALVDGMQAHDPSDWQANYLAKFDKLNGD